MDNKFTDLKYKNSVFSFSYLTEPIYYYIKLLLFFNNIVIEIKKKETESTMYMKNKFNNNGWRFMMCSAIISWSATR